MSGYDQPMEKAASDCIVYKAGPKCIKEPAGGGWWRCSWCGAFVREGCVTDLRVRIPVRYCPNCGGKVEER